MIQIDIANEQTAVAIDRRQLRRAVQNVLRDESIASAQISLAIVDDATIHSVNRDYLRHDHPTDVISFLLERSDGHLEGEIVASAETAQATAGSYGWSSAEELLLYVIHGMLHLAGYDDDTPAHRAAMRAREAHHLSRLGLAPHNEARGARRGHTGKAKSAASPPRSRKKNP